MRFGHLKVFHLHIQEERADQPSAKRDSEDGSHDAQQKIIADIMPHDTAPAVSECLEGSDLCPLFSDKAPHRRNHRQDRDEQEQCSEYKGVCLSLLHF